MGVRVQIQDARELGYCSRGMREFCARKQIDWEKFIAEGIDSDELRQYDDAMANRLIEQAEKRNAG
jgi:hypothetical protein